MRGNKKVLVSQALNSVLDTFSNCMVDFPVGSSDSYFGFGDIITTDRVGHYSAWDTYKFPDTIYTCTQKENYPVTNVGIDRDGSTIIQVAITGFSSDKIKIERDDMFLNISAEKEKSDKLKDVKWLPNCNNIATRSFNLSVEGNEKWNWEAIHADGNVSVENGILTIIVPLREEAKPKKDTYKIK